MYEIFTLGGGTYLVDLLNAVAAITGGGAFVTLAQIAGRLRPRLGALPNRLRGIVEGQRQVAASLRLRVGRTGGPEGDGAGGGPPRSGPGARRGGERAAGLGAVRLADEPGGGRAHAPERAGLLPPERPGIPPPRAHLRRAARRRRDPDGSHRRRLRPEPEGLRAAVRVPRPAPGAHIGRRPEREHGPLGARHRLGFAVRGRLARAHGGIRDEGRGLGHGRHDAGPGDRDLRGGRLSPGRPLGGGSHEGDRRLRYEALPGGRERGARAGRADGGAPRGARLPDRGIAERGPGPAPADGAERRARRGRAVERRGRERRGAQVLHRGAGGGPDRIGLPGHRQAGGDLGAHAADRVRVPLRGRVPDGGPADADPCGRRHIPLLLLGPRLAPELGAPLRDPAPGRHGRGRGAHERGRAHAGRRRRRIAYRPGRDTGG